MTASAAGGVSAAAAALLLCGFTVSPNASAEEQQLPLWELGFGVGALAFADYRGADTGRVYPLPVPYVIYRGRILRADRDGVRGLFFNQDWLELNISVGATTPVSSRDTPARHGMPNLRSTLEIGPSLDFHLWRSADRHVRLDLRVPARTAITIESSPRPIGGFLAPRLNIDFVDIGPGGGWNLGLLAGPLFANRRYHEYFYEVAPQYATVGRPAYDPHGGYAGLETLASVSKRYSGYWIGAFVRYDSLHGAVFTPSPLVRSGSYWATGIGIAWMIGQSSRTVDASERR
jgi:outer membrane protein